MASKLVWFKYLTQKVLRTCATWEASDS